MNRPVCCVGEILGMSLFIFATKKKHLDNRKVKICLKNIYYFIGHNGMMPWPFGHLEFNYWFPFDSATVPDGKLTAFLSGTLTRTEPGF